MRDCLRRPSGSVVRRQSSRPTSGAGESVELAAERLDVSVSTARTQLKAVFAKTNTHRQAELVALIGRLRSFQQQQQHDDTSFGGR
jgi:hypothetical protein